MHDEVGMIRDAIVNAVEVERLYMFSSHAYGTPSADSDYDFYMVIPNGGMRPIDAMTEAGLALWGTKVRATDIMAGAAEMFERRSQAQWTIEWEVARKGILLYER